MLLITIAVDQVINDPIKKKKKLMILHADACGIMIDSFQEHVNSFINTKCLTS